MGVEESVIELNEANKIQFDEDKHYNLFHNHEMINQIGLCKVSYRNGQMFGHFHSLHPQVKVLEGYPSIAYRKELSTGAITLLSVSICSTPNVDKSIPKVKIENEFYK